MPFFTFNQNNSGGYFDVDTRRGIDYVVIIEADNATQANEKAQQIGIYFDGVGYGRDCGCCGDRWRAARGYDGTDIPQVHSMPMAKYVVSKYPFWGDAYIHHANGTIERVTR